MDGIDGRLYGWVVRKIDEKMDVYIGGWMDR